MYFHLWWSTDGILKISFRWLNIKSYEITIVERDTNIFVLRIQNLSREHKETEKEASGLGRGICYLRIVVAGPSNACVDM